MDVERVLESRKNPNVAVGESSLPCKAPWNNMYFNTRGDVSPCWRLVGHGPRYSKHLNTITDIWNNESSLYNGAKLGFQNYRNALSNGEFLNKCKDCKADIDRGIWPLAKAYDEFPINKSGYPSLLELEVSNKCNLECVMCHPDRSSGLAKKLGLPLMEPYDDSFRQELKEYIPHLTQIRFNGGEPLLHDMFYDICEDISKLNPDCVIGLTTNGSVMNKNVKKVLKNNRVNPQISNDSLIHERYSKIRVNGKLDKWLENFEIFKKYAHEEETTLVINTNPMRNNWEEMPHFLDFVNENQVCLWFNTVLEPEHCAIWNLPSEELEHIYKTLSHELKIRKENKPIRPETEKTLKYGIDFNISVLENLVENEIKTWWEESLDI